MNQMNAPSSKYFGLSVGLALGMLGWIAYGAIGSILLSTSIGLAGIVYAAAFYFVPAVQPMLIEGFHHATFPIRWSMTLTVLAIVYYLVLTPIACWYRWSGKSIRRFNSDSRTNWQPTNIPADKESYFRTY